jgi:hypothetical protein
LRLVFLFAIFFLSRYYLNSMVDYSNFLLFRQPACICSVFSFTVG